MIDPVFVFGSNLAGRHGKGAALWARKYRGAVYGQGEGYQGNSYAIPTKGYKLEVLPLSSIAAAITRFRLFVSDNPELSFQLTPVGCGLAGFNRKQIEPLFFGLPSRVLWPPEWKNSTEYLE